MGITLIQNLIRSHGKIFLLEAHQEPWIAELATIITGRLLETKKVKRDLPMEAKLDYGEDMDKLHSDTMEQVKSTAHKNADILKKNFSLGKQIHDILIKEQKVFAEVGVQVDEGNPIICFPASAILRTLSAKMR
jgi:hypothetical protein